MNGANVEEAPCCRVCHGESEPGNELFFPCKCDGSIKYVHQECLVQWLKVAGKENPKCELCGEPFHFQKVYKNDTPYQIALLDVALELIPRTWSLLHYTLATGLAMVLWVILLPLFTNWWVKVCWCFVTTSSSSCLTLVPAFVEARSVEGFVTFWYFGLVDVCIILATSVVSYEIGHMIYKEYQAVGNNQHLRVLERRLAVNLATMQRMEEESLRRERTLFAVADYESMKYEWDSAKRALEQHIHVELPTAGGIDNTTEHGSPPIPSIEDRFRMVQSLINDERYCGKVVDRLSVVCESAQAVPAFASVRDSFAKLHAELVSTNQQCAALVNLLPSSINPHHPAYLGTQESNLAALQLFAEAQTGPTALADTSPEDTADAADEVPWYEQDTGYNLDEIEPTMDNLELRVNLLMRRRLQEEAAERRILQNNLMYGAKLASTTTEHPSVWHNHREIGCGDEEIANANEYGDADAIPQQCCDECESAKFPDDFDVQTPEQYGDHSLNHAMVETESAKYVDELQDQQHDTIAIQGPPSQKHFPADSCWTDPPNEYEGDLDELASAGNMDEEYHAESSELCGDDEAEVRHVLETMITHLELAACDIEDTPMDVEGEDGHPMGDHEVHGGPVDQQAAMPMARPEIPPLHAPAPAEAPAGLQVGLPGPGGNPAVLAAAAVAVRNDDPFLKFRTIAIAYFYVLIFVITALLVPSFLGGVFLAHTSAGTNLKERVHAQVLEMLSSEENYQTLMKFLDYMNFSVEDIEAQEDKSVAAELVLTNLQAAVNLMVGYAFYMSVPIGLFCGCYLQYATDFAYNENMMNLATSVTRQVSNIGEYAHTGAKLAILGTVQGIIVPALFALLAVKFVDRSLPVYMRYNELEASANFAVWLILFVFAHLFIVHIRQVTFEARVAINPKYLVGILPETPVLGPRQEAVALSALHEKLRVTSYLQVLKAILIRVCIQLPSFVAGVIVPIRLGHLLCPLAEPLLFRMHFQKQMKVDAQIPVEMILWHIFLPIIIEKMRYVSVVKQVVSSFLSVAAPAMGMPWLLDATPLQAGGNVPRPMALPPAGDVAASEGGTAPADDALPTTIDTSSWPLWARASALLVLSLMTLSLLSSWILHAPLTVGRWVMQSLSLSPYNDVYNYPIGMLLCWGCCFVVQYIVKDVARNAGAVSAVKSTLKWLAVAGKVLSVGVLWLGVPPFLLGVLIEALIIVPLRMTPFETSQFPYLQNWALGLIILKAVTKCILSGMFGEIALRTDMEMVLIRGFEQFDATHALRTILCPVCIMLLDLLLIPHFLARVTCAFVPSYLLRTLVMRFCYHAYILLRIGAYAAYCAVTTLIKLHNEVRDSKYLIGTKLTNRSQGG